MTTLRNHWQLLALTTILFVIWSTPVAWPLRMLIVLFHEISHGAAAVLTGGSVERLELSRFEGGAAWTRGGNGFVIASAGYLGSLLIGLGFLLVAVRSRWDRIALAACGALILWAALFYVRDWFTFGFCVATAAVMIAIAWALRAEAADLILRVVGLTSMAYVPWDIWDDTIRHRPLGEGVSDAAAIANSTFGSETFWGILWLGLSLAAILAAVRWGLGANSNIGLRALVPKKRN